MNTLGRLILELNTWVQEDCTLGRLSVGDFQCFTLELPWKDNQTNISCIPEGEYKVVKFLSPTNGNVLSLLKVPGRVAIQIHAGNYTRNILGCILVGDSIKFLDKDSIPDVTNSKATLTSLLALLPYEAVIRITRSISP